MEARLIKQLDKKIASNNLYDAHQMLASIFERYARTQNISEGTNFAQNYCSVFADRGEYELCIQTGECVFDLLVRCAQQPSEENLELLSSFFLMGGNSESKYDFMNKIILWSKKMFTKDDPQHTDGSHSLQYMIANSYLEDKNYGACQRHIIFTNDASFMKSLLDQWQSEGYQTETHLFALRMVLLLLNRDKVAMAEDLLDKLNFDWNSEEIPVAIQIAYILTNAVKYNDLSLAEMVSRKYPLVLRLDDDLGLMYNNILVKNFPQTQPVQPSFNLADLLGGMKM